MTTIVTRADAKSVGAVRYFTGKPCSNGHVALRITINANCEECSLNRGRIRYTSNREKERERSHRYRSEKSEEIRIQRSQYREENREALCQKNAEWRLANHVKVKENCALWHAENRDSANARRKENRASNLEAQKAREAEWRSNNIERKRSTTVAWRLKNIDRLKSIRDIWVIENKELLKTYRRNRRARNRACPGTHTKEDIVTILKNQRGKCAYCKVRLSSGYHVDHIIALARGGDNDRRNLQILCAPCNLSKGAKDPITFARSRGYLL